MRLVSCILLLAGGMLVLGRYVHAMATTSLWTDELHTILHYSGRGPLVTLTEYHEPNNHVFFNLVNSLTPGRRSVQPVRARLWSFAATFAMLGLAFVWFARRGSPEWGAFLFSVLAIQTELLDLVLQARGYGFLCLFALIASILTLALAGEVTRRRLVGLAIVSVLGTWTVPTFVFFVGALWVLLLVATRRRDVFVAAAGTVAGIAIAYAPIATQIVEAQRVFNREFPGGEFSRLAAVRDVLDRYLLHPAGSLQPWKIAGIVVIVIGVIALLPRGPGESKVVKRGVILVMGAVAAFLVACLLLKGPPLRTAAFVAVPIAFSATTLLQIASRRWPRRSQVVVLALALGLFARSRTLASEIRFTPWEAWMELAATLHETFPEGTPFFVSENPVFLAGYLAPRDVTAQTIDVGDFSRGLEIYLDTPLLDPPKGRLDARQYVSNAIEYRIPQRRAGYQALWFCPPNRSFLLGVRSSAGNRFDSVCDRDLRTGTGELLAGPGAVPMLRLEFEPGRRYRSLVVVTADDKARFEVEAFSGAPAHRLSVGPVRHARDVTLIPLHDEMVSFVSLTPASGERRLPSISETWAYAVP